MQNIFSALIIFLFILTPHKANAISPGPIIKGFKAIGNFFKKGVDEAPDIGKKLEELKTNKKIDEVLNPSSGVDDVRNMNEVNNYKYKESILSDIENLNKEELLEAHNVKKIKKFDKRDVDQLLDVIDGVNSIGDVTLTASIIPFIETEWSGKIFRSSKYFNNPKIQDRILIKCSTNLEDFYFTALFDQKKGGWFLLSGNFTRKNKGIYIPELKRQELLILKDLHNYLYFSNKPKGIKKYPTKYFVINNEAKFISEANIDEKKDPDFFLNKMIEKIDNSLSKCERI